MCDAKLPHKVRHVTHACAAKSVDALVVVAHRHHRATGQRRRSSNTVFAGSTLPGQHFDPGVLQFVGILKLIDQNMPKAPLVMLAHSCIVPEQLITAQHEFTKIDHALALALLFIKRINLNFFAHVLVANRYVLCTLAFFFTTCDEVHQLLGRKTLVVNVELLAQTLDAGQLVLCVQNLEC